jgi:hypothetical protein
MTWYYADWSWIQRFITSAVLVVGCVVVACAIATLVRSHLTAHHAEVIVTNGFVRPSRAEIERQVRQVSNRRNGSRAA